MKRRTRTCPRCDARGERRLIRPGWHVVPATDGFVRDLGAHGAWSTRCLAYVEQSGDTWIAKVALPDVSDSYLPLGRYESHEHAMSGAEDWRARRGTALE